MRAEAVRAEAVRRTPPPAELPGLVGPENHPALPQRGADGGFTGPRRVSRVEPASKTTPLDQALLRKVLAGLRSLN